MDQDTPMLVGGAAISALFVIFYLMSKYDRTVRPLRPCPACGNRVSKDAYACPNCGKRF